MPNKDIITIDPNQISEFVVEGKKLVFSPQAEEALYKLLKVRDMIEAAIEEVQNDIQAAGEAVYPGFKGVEGAKVKAVSRAWGEVYGVDKTMLDQLPPEFYKKTETVKYSADSKVVEKFAKEKGGLPVGIYKREREKKVKVSLIETKELDNVKPVEQIEK